MTLNTSFVSGIRMLLYESGQVITGNMENNKASMQYDKYLTSLETAG